MIQKILQIFFFICFVVFFFACSKPKVEIPKSVLAKDKMVPLLADVHIASAAVAMNRTSDTARASMADYMQYILKIHNVTQLQYDSSVAFYTRHPELMGEIYDSVINELSKKQSQVSAH